MNKWWKVILGVSLGVIGGYSYYHFVDCESGTCSVWSSPYKSIAYGAALGGILFFDTKTKKDGKSDGNS